MSSQVGKPHVVGLGASLIDQFSALAKTRAERAGDEWCALVQGDMLNLQMIAMSNRNKMREIAALPDLIQLARMVMRGGELSESFDLAEKIFKGLGVEPPTPVLNEVAVVQDPASSQIFEPPPPSLALF